MKSLQLFLVTLLSACACGTFAAQEMSQEGQYTVPSVGRAAPVSKLQGGALKEYEQRFSKLDQNDDGYITIDEAKMSPRLIDYWKEKGLGDDGKMDRAAFLKYESVAQTGTKVYKSGRATPGGFPATKHQEEVVEPETE
jgi:hypothetical protein